MRVVVHFELLQLHIYVNLDLPFKKFVKRVIVDYSIIKTY